MYFHEYLSNNTKNLIGSLPLLPFTIFIGTVTHGQVKSRARETKTVFELSDSYVIFTLE